MIESYANSSKSKEFFIQDFVLKNFQDITNLEIHDHVNLDLINSNHKFFC